jgi:hypothetical protein
MPKPKTHQPKLIRALDRVIFITLLLVGLGLVWEYATQQYWSGLADAILPLHASPEEKVEAILAWMNRWADRASNDRASGEPLDRIASFRGLRYLNDCGAATNIILNLSSAGGFRARRLLLLGEDGRTKHVVVEVLASHRWIVVATLRRAVFRGKDSQALTREQLADPEVFQQAIAAIPGYDPDYTFQRTANIRVEKIPVAGGMLWRVLNKLLPEWEGWLAESLVFDRRSRLFTACAVCLLAVAVLVRLFAGWRLRRRSS